MNRPPAVRSAVAANRRTLMRWICTAAGRRNGGIMDKSKKRIIRLVIIMSFLAVVDTLYLVELFRPSCRIESCDLDRERGSKYCHVHRPSGFRPKCYMTLCREKVIPGGIYCSKHDYDYNKKNKRNYNNSSSDVSPTATPTAAPTSTPKPSTSTSSGSSSYKSYSVGGYSSSSSSSKKSYSQKTYDDGYDDVYNDGEPDWDRYYTDDHYAAGADDAMDEYGDDW